MKCTSYFDDIEIIDIYVEELDFLEQEDTWLFVSDKNEHLPSCDNSHVGLCKLCDFNTLDVFNEEFNFLENDEEWLTAEFPQSVWRRARLHDRPHDERGQRRRRAATQVAERLRCRPQKTGRRVVEEEADPLPNGYRYLKPIIRYTLVCIYQRTADELIHRCASEWHQYHKRREHEHYK